MLCILIDDTFYTLPVVTGCALKLADGMCWVPEHVMLVDLTVRKISRFFLKPCKNTHNDPLEKTYGQHNTLPPPPQAPIARANKHCSKQ